mmetsp:Transcript_84204/g.212314  ORF Transcript_84204/g.212314 Transcript_84204/m.212314 type:complete len:216 (+) Transcript_84204:99-746(+)
MPRCELRLQGKPTQSLKPLMYVANDFAPCKLHSCMRIHRAAFARVDSPSTSDHCQGELWILEHGLSHTSVVAFTIDRGNDVPRLDLPLRIVVIPLLQEALLHEFYLQAGRVRLPLVDIRSDLLRLRVPPEERDLELEPCLGWDLLRSLLLHSWLLPCRLLPCSFDLQRQLLRFFELCHLGQRPEQVWDLVADRLLPNLAHRDFTGTRLVATASVA